MFKSCRENKTSRLYDKSKEKIEKSLDIVKIIKSLLHAHTFTREYFIRNKELFEMEHDQKNLIKLDSSESDQNYSESDEKEEVHAGVCSPHH